MERRKLLTAVVLLALLGDDLQGLGAMGVVLKCCHPQLLDMNCVAG